MGTHTQTHSHTHSLRRLASQNGIRQVAKLGHTGSAKEAKARGRGEASKEDKRAEREASQGRGIDSARHVLQQQQLPDMS